jgi:hypothetical protein
VTVAAECASVQAQSLIWRVAARPVRATTKHGCPITADR